MRTTSAGTATEHVIGSSQWYRACCSLPESDSAQELSRMAEKAKHVHASHIGSMIPQTVIVKGGSYSSCIVIPLEVRIVGRHVPKP